MIGVDMSMGEIMNHSRKAVSRRHQRGAVFFVSMMLLIILSLLAISAAQVTGLQERMAGVYRADYVAFENAEGRLRQTERSLLTEADPCFKADVDAVSGWQANPAGTDATSTIRNLAVGESARAFAWRGSSQTGIARTGGDAQCSYFSVSVIDHDAPGADRTSSAIVQSIFVP